MAVGSMHTRRRTREINRTFFPCAVLASRTRTGFAAVESIRVQRRIGQSCRMVERWKSRKKGIPSLFHTGYSPDLIKVLPDQIITDHVFLERLRYGNLHELAL